MTCYQVKASLDGKVAYFGMTTTRDDPVAAALLSLGPGWFGSKIEIEPILPRDDRPGRSSGRDA